MTITSALARDRPRAAQPSRLHLTLIQLGPGTAVLFSLAVVPASPAGLIHSALALRGWRGSFRTCAAGLGNLCPPTTWPPCSDASTRVGVRGRDGELLKASLRDRLAWSTGLYGL